MGINRLSFIGTGKYSINMAIAAPIAANHSAISRLLPIVANHGAINRLLAKKAKMKPEKLPSNVLPLLNGNLMPIVPPKIEAALSPNVNVAIAAALTGYGKTVRVISIPMA